MVPRPPGRRSRWPWRSRQVCQNAPMTTSDHEGEPITEAGLAALKAEIGELETVARRDIAARILTARGHGDLKENAEYHAAKEDQAHLETRILRLRQRLRNAVVVDVESEPPTALPRSPSVAPRRSPTRAPEKRTRGPSSASPRPTAPPASSPRSRRWPEPSWTSPPAPSSPSPPLAASDASRSNASSSRARRAPRATTRPAAGLEGPPVPPNRARLNGGRGRGRGSEGRAPVADALVDTTSRTPPAHRK